jgi:lipoyl(octanoyl) transferase
LPDFYLAQAFGPIRLRAYNKHNMIEFLYLGRVDYDEALRLQAEITSMVAAGLAHNVLLLLEHPPVLTLGRNAKRANVLASDEMLQRRGITLHQINRGGDVTYHGPGQLIGYPIFDLRTMKNSKGARMGPVDFVRGMEEALIRLCGEFGVAAGRISGLTGVWCDADRGVHARKIGAIGIHVARGITSHGFAFNVTTNLRDFDLIVPCGIRDHAVTSLEREVTAGVALPSLETFAHQAAQQFSAVFDEPVTPVEGLAALRALAASGTPPQFPAEDTPLQIPPELERLHSTAERPVRA